MNASQESFFQGGLRGAVERGRLARDAWIRDGVLLSSAEFAARYGVAVDALLTLESKGELFSVEASGEPYWPAELLKLEPGVVAKLCRALGADSGSAKLTFLMRSHGALAGHSVADAVRHGQLADVLRLARTWRNR